MRRSFVVAQLFNRLSETLHEATKELLDLFAINADVQNGQSSSDINDAEEKTV